jgi:hypothetical protein
VHRLAGHVAVNQRLRQPLGQGGRALKRRQPGGEGDQRLVPAVFAVIAAIAVRREGDPDRAAADLVAGALDQDAAGGQARPQPGPGRPGPLLGVLAQHVERAHEHRTAGRRQLEAARRERQPGQGVPAGAQRRQLPGGERDPYLIDLQAGNLGVRRHGADPSVQLHRGHRRGAEAQVHDQRARLRAERRLLRLGYPAVHPP